MRNDDTTFQAACTSKASRQCTPSTQAFKQVPKVTALGSSRSDRKLCNSTMQSRSDLMQLMVSL